MTKAGGTESRIQCAIAGGGPAGLMLGVLLARAGVRVRVFEKHGDFLRDFRGDTIHPSTLEVVHELGWIDEFLQLPHQKVYQASGVIGGTKIDIADFRHLPVKCPYIALMPQWDFLNFLAEKGRSFAGFRLDMNAEAIDLIDDQGEVKGLRVRTAQGEEDVFTDLVVAADGRGSRVRKVAGLNVLSFGAPIDALWFRVPRKPDDGDASFGRFDAGRILIMLNRKEYWQCAYIIQKGGRDLLEAQGLSAFRDSVALGANFDRARMENLRSWDDVKLLRVRVDRLERWFKDGLLCIGDAAHAMSPIGGVGVNLAVQDAVAAANLLAEPLRNGRFRTADLEDVQQRREWPTKLTQKLQLVAQKRVIAAMLRAEGPVHPPLPLRMLNRFPMLQRLPARLIGMGVRPEHVDEAIVQFAA